MIARGSLLTSSVCCFPGCVIAELFTEGVPLFDLSQLLAYRNGHFFPEQVLNKIEDQSIRELVIMSTNVCCAVLKLGAVCICIRQLSAMLRI